MERFNRRSDLQYGSEWGNRLIKLGNVSVNPKSELGCTYSIFGLSPTICAGTHGYCIGHILVKEALNNNKGDSI